MRARRFGIAIGLWVAVIGCSRDPAAEPPRSTPAPAAREATGPDERWNVIVIAPDTFRGDRLSANGYERETTPNLDALAADGINFPRTVTVAPRTWQSFSSILTGLYPPRHGVRFIYDHPVPESVPVLGSYLRRFGYETAAFDGIQFLRAMTGGKHFDQYVTSKASDGQGGDAGLLEAVETFVRESRGPYLAFARLSGGHWPYTDRSFLPADHDCKDYDHGFNRGTYGLKQEGREMQLADEDAFRKLIWTPDADPRQKAHRIAHYDSEIHQTDELIGGLLDRLRADGLLDRTIVAITSDHGESFGEHGYLQHGPRVDESVMHVPLILHLPEGHPDRRPGLVIDSLARVIDLFPTLLDVLGLPPPPDLDGVSLMPLVRGAQAPGERWAYGESGRSFMQIDPERHLAGVEGKHRMLRRGRWKLVYVPDESGGRPRLYDVEADPEERHDVAGAHPDVVASLFAHVQAVSASSIEDDEEPELSGEQLDRLRALGYVQ